MTNKKLPFTIAAILCLLLAGVFVFLKSFSPLNTSDETQMGLPSSDLVEKTPETGSLTENQTRNSSQSPEAQPSTRPDGKDEGSAKLPTKLPTKVRNRGVPDFTAKKLARVDMTPPADEGSPPPDGPALFADVRTETKHYLNLRPNNVGVMPMIQVGGSEFLLVHLTFPDSSPGEKIYAHLSDGGSFPDIEATGRIYQVDEKRSLAITLQASDTRGNCTLMLRQAGHDRTLPLWVGAPMEQASTDPTSR